MAPLRTPSEANVELAKLVTEAGNPTTARQVRTWRSNGWVPQAEVRALGRGRGKAAVNTEESFKQALTVAETRGGKRTSPHLIVLALFARGFAVSEVQLRAAYATYFGRKRAELEKATAGAETDFDAAEQLAGGITQAAHRQRSGRYLMSRAARTGESPAAMLETVLTVVASALLGGDVRELFDHFDPSGVMSDAIDELLEVTGMAGLAKPVGAAVPIVSTRAELREDVLSWIENSSIDSLERASQELPLADLVFARDSFKLVWGAVKALNAITKAAGSPDDAFGTRFASMLKVGDEEVAFLAVMMASLLKHLRPAVEEGLPLIEASAQRAAAVEEMLGYFPKHLHRFLGPEGSERLARAHKATREEFERSFQAFKDQRPDLEEIRATPVEIEP